MIMRNQTIPKATIKVQDVAKNPPFLIPMSFITSIMMKWFLRMAVSRAYYGSGTPPPLSRVTQYS